MRSVLRPGTHVLRRGPSEVQVGLDPREAVVLPATPEVRAALDRLATGTPPTQPADPTLDVLAGYGLLMDERVARGLGGSPHSGRPDPRPVRADVFGHPSGARLLEQLTTLLAAAGLEVTPAGVAPVAVLLGVGEPDRTRLDPWVRDADPHLVVRMAEGRATVGPFVVPGQTACLRCIDAHHTDDDPQWPLLVTQYAAASSTDRADGIGEPVDPMLAAVAVGWAARDLATYAEGGRPSTWSATVTLDRALTGVETHSWLRHPECGCSWA